MIEPNIQRDILSDFLPTSMLNKYVYCSKLFYIEWLQQDFQDSAETIDGKTKHRYVNKEAGDSLSYKFSGRKTDGSIIKGHRHIFIIFLDYDKDGYLDHMLIKCKYFFNAPALLTLDNLTSMLQSNKRPVIRLIPVQLGKDEDIQLYECSNLFRSKMSVVLTTHYRDWREDYWLEFVKSKKGKTDKIGNGFELEFSGPVNVSIFSIGYGAHYGLGMFLPKNGK